VCRVQEHKSGTIKAIWSLLDMAERFRVATFATVMAQMRESAALIDFSIPNGAELVRVALKDADKEFKELKLSLVLRTQWQRLLERSETASLQEIKILIREMNNNLLVELDSAWFLIIPADRRFPYEQPSPIFGQDVHSAFPDARRDIAASGRCYALDEWTACVIHLMRALEHGLRWLADQVGLGQEAVSNENWKNVIDQIEKKIRELEALPKSDDKRKRTQFFSEAAIQFRWFKDAWRNYAMHSHEHYDEREGAIIFLHLSDFFRHIGAEAMRPTL
jgi:hypothetical protein